MTIQLICPVEDFPWILFSCDCPGILFRLDYESILGSEVSAIGDLALVAGGAEGGVVVVGRDHSLPTDNVDDGLVLPHIVLHLLLDVSVVLQQVAQMLLAAGQISLQLAVLGREVLVDSSDLLAFLPHFLQVPTFLADAFLYLL